MQTAKARTTVTMMLLISLGLSAICVSVLPAVGQKAGPAVEELRAGKNFIATKV